MQVKEETSQCFLQTESARDPVLMFNKDAALVGETSPGGAENSGVAQVRVELARLSVILRLRSTKRAVGTPPAESSRWGYLCRLSFKRSDVTCKQSKSQADVRAEAFTAQVVAEPRGQTPATFLVWSAVAGVYSRLGPDGVWRRLRAAAGAARPART